ncbi:MAG: prepilin peptidase [Elusimicrobiota bacterium]
MIEFILVIISGLALGSFANVLIYRIQEGMSVIKPRSFCPVCKKPIKWYDNVPVLSYILLNGRCRQCGEKIPVSYLLVEIVTPILFLAVYSGFNDWGQRFVYAIFVYSMLVISVIDLQRSVIPDILSLPLILFGIISSPWTGTGVLQSVIGAACGIIVFLIMSFAGKRIFKKDALGGGDVKLAGVFGAFLGWEGLLVSVFVGSLIGTLTSLALIYVIKKKRWGDYIPFGPFLCAGAFLALFLV